MYFDGNVSENKCGKKMKGEFYFSKVFMNIGISVHLLYDIVIEMDFKQDDEETHFMTTDEDQSEPAKKEIEEEEFKINYADVKSMKFFRCKICVFESPDKKTFEKHINDNQHQG